MAWDSSKDKLIEEVGTFVVSETQSIVCSIHQYGDGEYKVQLARHYPENDRHGKLGRMTYEELEGVDTLLIDALNWEGWSEDEPEETDED